MNWILLVISFLLPIVQPVVQQNVNQVQQRLQQRMQQAQQQPSAAADVPQYHFDGQHWYCHWNGRWYIWVPNGS